MWLRSSFNAWKPPDSRASVVRKRCRRARLEVEYLEGRCLLSAVHALFDLRSPDSGPFPSNVFTVADNTQNTGRRVNLPLPDPTTHLSDYQDTEVLNTLDGFNLQPRLSIPFDGLINVNTVSSQDLFLVSLGDTLPGGAKGGEVVGINQIVWDPATTTLHVESDALLDQHTRYALIVTDGIHGSNGKPVEATDAFREFRKELSGDLKFYKKDLKDALKAAKQQGVKEKDIVTASVFTTESATAVQEKIRDQIHAATPQPADFNLGSNGEPTIFNVAQVQSVTFNEQVGASPLHFTPVPLPIKQLDIMPGAVGTVAFGRYLSPDYEIHPGEYIPPVATLTGTPVVQSMDEVYFNLFLPSGPKPDGGWPVAIFGHGGASNKNEALLAVAASLAAQGIATMGINAAGNGFGPLGTLAVKQSDGSVVTLPAGGRSFDQDGNGDIGGQEGFFAAAPRQILWSRDSQRQTVADLMQLVREIQVGINVSGDTTADLDSSRIYYFGTSLGGEVGTEFLAVEPDVRAGVITSGFGPFIETNRLGAGSRVGRQTRIEPYLQARTPSLSNPPGIVAMDGLAVGTGVFNENMPLRDGIPLEVRLSDGTSQTVQSPVINTVRGAMDIQRVFDETTWVSLSGDALGYAAHLRKAPLPGVPAKSVIIQFGKGDQSAPNPTETALVRAGDLADVTTLFRTDLAVAEDAKVPTNPHKFMIDVADPDPLAVKIALGAQKQIATFFAADGQEIIHPEPARFFETPIQGSLPEDLNFILGNGPTGATAPMSVSPVSGPPRMDPPRGTPTILELPTTLTVLRNAASGPGPLRATIAAANGGDKIVFDLSIGGQTIMLTSGELVIDMAGTVTVRALEITQKRTDGGVGGVGGTGGDDLGEAIDEDALSSLTLTHATVERNRAVGGSAGTGGSDGQGVGARFYNAGGTVRPDHTKIKHNHASSSDDDVFGSLS
jgi:hypothetical protein